MDLDVGDYRSQRGTRRSAPSFPMFTRPTNMGDKAFSVRAGYRGGCQTPVQALQVMIAAEDGRKC